MPTKRFFQAVARDIFDVRESLSCEPGAQDVLDMLIPRLCGTFKEANPRFLKDRFMEACLTGQTKGMKKRG